MKPYTCILSVVAMLTAFAAPAQAQTKESGVPAITLTTNGAQTEGTLLTFSIGTLGDGFYVDFGNGNTRDYPWGGTVAFSDRTYGDTIRIYANSADYPIKTFSCKNDSLQAIALDCAELEMLDCSNNQIAKLDLSGCPKLQQVYASRNQLYEFLYSTGTELTYLDVARNAIATLNVGAADKLEHLDASVNSLRAVSRLTLASAAPLKYLDLSCNNFSTVSISSFKQLETLYLNNCTRLKTIDLSPFAQLRQLRAQYTGVSSLDLTRCPQLEYADVSGTGLTSLNLSANTQLRTLRANLVALSSLDLSGNPRLERLTIQKCGLSTLDLTANTALTHLDYQGNSIPTPDLSANTALTYLDCSDNGVQTLSLTALTELDTLLCSVNELASIDLSANTRLKKLNCSSNALTSLDISNNKALSFLDCSDNALTALSVSKQVGLEGLSVKSNQMSQAALESLFLTLPDINGLDIDAADVLWKGVVGYSNNPGSADADTSTLTGKGWKSDSATGILGDASAIAVVQPDMVGTRYDITIECAEDFQVDWGDGVKVNYPYSGTAYQNLEGVLEGSTIKFYAPRATVLALSNHYLTQLNVDGMTQLTRLACSGNAISDLDLSSLTKLQQLTCGDNPLTALRLGNAPELTSLSCKNTLIKDLDLSACKHLQTLVLESNRLQTLNVTGCTELQTVDATFNNLSAIDLSNAPNLTTAYLGKNRLQQLDLSKSLDLQYLSVSYNQLKEFDASMLNSLLQFECNDNQLETLSVSSPTLSVFMAMNNHLRSLDIKDCTALTYLALNNNALTELDLSGCTALENLWLDGNQLTEVSLPDQKLSKFTLFSIADNRVADFKFANLPAAKEIVLTNNCFAGTLDLSACGSLEKLFASGNSLEGIDFASSTTLTTVIVNDNHLKTLRVPSTMLYWLEACRNQLTAVDVSQSTNLMLFHADENRLNSINFKTPDNLASIYLRNNLFEAEALNAIYDVLPNYSGTTVSAEYADWMDWIRVSGNPGATESDVARAQLKGWNVEADAETGISLTEATGRLFAFDASTGRGRLSTDGAKATVRLFTASGQGVPLSVAGSEFCVGSLPRGVYILKVQTGGQSMTRKITVR